MDLVISAHNFSLEIFEKETPPQRLVKRELFNQWKIEKLKYSSAQIYKKVKLLPKCDAESSKGDVTRDDSQRQFSAQHCFEWLQHCSSIAKLCCTKNRRYESFRVTSP